MAEPAASTVDVDVLVVGGGINGAGIARDAAGRGLTVLLCEQDDLAGHTSSASTKLIHGGLRYLEHYDFALVRKALQEREVLLRAAPHIIWPLRFVMPHDAHLRPAWMIRAGLFLYDHLARRERLPGSQSLDLTSHTAGAPLVSGYRRGFAYSDGWVDDSRLVVLNALDARERGARVLTRTRMTEARRVGPRWSARLERSGVGGKTLTVGARALVNAAGPWAGRVHDLATESPAARHVRLVKGSHIVVPRLFEHDYAYIFQNPDRRIIFAIPYEGEFTLIGTTDVDHGSVDDSPQISAEEVAYLCEMANRYFQRRISAQNVVSSYAGVRPLLEDESADPASVTRDYSLEFEAREPALLSVFGGKITTYRRLAEDAVDLIADALGRRQAAPPWTRGAPLPGGDMPHGDFESFLDRLEQRLPWLTPERRYRYARLYGTRLMAWLGGVTSMAAAGPEILPGLFEREARYLCEQEFAREGADILWRRTKLGLRLQGRSTAPLDTWLAAWRSSEAIA
jgi:glycerol-3-phosphate dehydrogenase